MVRYNNLSKRVKKKLNEFSKPYLDWTLQQINQEIEKKTRLVDRWASIDNIVNNCDQITRSEVRAYVNIIQNEVLAPRIYQSNKRSYSYNLKLCYNAQKAGNGDKFLDESFNVYSKRGWAWTKRIDAINNMLANHVNISTKTLEALSEMQNLAYKSIERNKKIANKEEVMKGLKILEEKIAERKSNYEISYERKNNFVDSLSNYTTNIFSKIRKKSSIIIKSTAGILIGAIIYLNGAVAISGYSSRHKQEDKIVPIIQSKDVQYKEDSLENIVKSVDSPKEDIPPEGYVYWKTIKAKVTAYEPSEYSCGKYADGKTSIGENAWKFNGVAADPRAIPYGTLVYIEGIGFKKVDDTGGAMRKSWRERGQYHLDIRMGTIKGALKWGVQNKEVRLYRKIPSI